MYLFILLGFPSLIDIPRSMLIEKHLRNVCLFWTWKVMPPFSCERLACGNQTLHTPTSQSQSLVFVKHSEWQCHLDNETLMTRHQTAYVFTYSLNKIKKEYNLKYILSLPKKIYISEYKCTMTILWPPSTSHLPPLPMAWPPVCHSPSPLLLRNGLSSQPSSHCWTVW